MRPTCIRIPYDTKETFIVDYSYLPGFKNFMHYHDGCQLAYFFQSGGFLYLGDKSLKIKKGELYLIGENVPHFFHLNENVYDDKSLRESNAISLFFNIEKLRGIFENITDTDVIKNFLEYTSQGAIKVSDDRTFLLGEQMKEVKDLKGFERVMKCMNIFSLIANNYNPEIIEATLKIESDNDSNLGKVYNYVLDNFRDKISINDVASIACMTPTSFSRFFKQNTDQSFSAFLTGIRINHACALLANGSYSISEVCYTSGFNNLSNFHRHFLNVIGITPSEYRNSFQSAESSLELQIRS